MGKKTIRAAAALLALALTAAACSSGSSSSSPTTGSKLTGSPIVIGQILPMTGAALQLPQMNETLVAAVNYYNAHGGLFGHPLKVDLCDSQDSATSEVATW
jgi:ABC-type branched-subunit amino acid transport system substrate-binding protein